MGITLDMYNYFGNADFVYNCKSDDTAFIPKKNVKRYENYGMLRNFVN